MGKYIKAIEKQPSQTVPLVEILMGILLGVKQTFLNQADVGSGYFILIDWTDAKAKKLEKVQEWITLLGDMLRDNATKQFNTVVREINEYDKQLKSDMGGSLEIIKHLLKVIDEIRLKSMDMEFEIHEVVEQFRILKRYKHPVDEDLALAVSKLATDWEELLERAERKDFDVNDYKKNYAEMTKGDVLRFKTELKEEYEKYVAGGPGADQVSLEDGLHLLELSRDQNKRFNARKEECVLAEKLFNLPISKFPELIQMEMDNAVLEQIYGIYKDH
jgi:dynein heavy chain